MKPKHILVLFTLAAMLSKSDDPVVQAVSFPAAVHRGEARTTPETITVEHHIEDRRTIGREMPVAPAEFFSDPVSSPIPDEVISYPTMEPDKLISVDTWMTPMPAHSRGLLVYYGPQRLIEVNADYRGYDLSPFNRRCGVSAISPSDIGKVVWLRVETEWFGPCLTIDDGARGDYFTQVWITREIAEVSDWMRDMFQFPYGSSRPGEVYVGLCPPGEDSQAQIYQPPLVWSPEPSPLFITPPQQYPVDCGLTAQGE